MRASKVWLLIWALLALVLTTLPLGAQTSDQQPGAQGTERSVSLLYPGGRIYKYDQPFPLVFEFSNSQSTAKAFEFEWTSRSPIPAAWRRFTLGPGEKRRLSVVFPSRGVSGLYGATLNGRDVPLELSAASNQPVVAILAPSQEGFDYLRSLAIQSEPTYPSGSSEAVMVRSALNHVTRLDPQVLPETWATLSHLDVIVAHDVLNLGLNRKQLEALLQWCQWKGHLVLVSNGLPDEFKGSPFQDWLPLTPKGLDTSNHMSKIVGDLHPEAKVLQSFHGQPLLTSRPVVNGRLFFATAPLTELGPLTQAEGEQLWEQVLTDLSGQIQATAGHLIESMPELPKIQAGYIAIIILLYALLVGPVNLGYLRRKDLMLWSFVTVPAIAVLFAGSVYLLSLVNRSSEPVLREIGTLSLKNGASIGPAGSELVLFSPSNRAYTLTSDPSAFFGEFQYRHRGGRIELYTPAPGGGVESGLSLTTWDLAALESVSLKTLEKPITVTCEGEEAAVVVSPLATEPNQAAIWLPGRGTSQPFTLQVGENRIPLHFPQTPGYGYGQFSCSEWLNDDPPGRRRLLDQLNSWSNHSKSETGYLLLWTSELPTPIGTEPEALHRSDTLILVTFDAPEKETQ